MKKIILCLLIPFNILARDVTISIYQNEVFDFGYSPTVSVKFEQLEKDNGFIFDPQEKVIELTCGYNFVNESKFNSNVADLTAAGAIIVKKDLKYHSVKISPENICCILDGDGLWERWMILSECGY